MEYEIETIVVGAAITDSDLTKEINIKAEQGWSLLTATTHFEQGGTILVLFWQRPKQVNPELGAMEMR